MSCAAKRGVVEESGQVQPKEEGPWGIQGIALHRCLLFCQTYRGACLWCGVVVLGCVERVMSGSAFVSVCTAPVLYPVAVVCRVRQGITVSTLASQFGCRAVVRGDVREVAPHLRWGGRE